METVYLYCAAIGGGLLVLQVLMMLVGGGDTDFDTGDSPNTDVVDASASTVLFQLSLKTVIAFVTFFGLAGMACVQADVGHSATLIVALVAGFAAFLMVGYLMQLMLSLQTKGNVDLKSAIGRSAKVDLRIPANRSGTGKISVVAGGRLVTQKAVTSGDAIPTGADVVIKGMTAPDTFEVSTPQ